MIELPNQIRDIIHYNVNTAVKKIYRYGVEMEKGAVMSIGRIQKNRELYERYFNFWIQYPDLLIIKGAQW